MYEPESGWFYTGEIIDPDQSPLTQSVYSCDACGALVAGTSDHRSIHEQWHRRMDAAPVLPRIGLTAATNRADVHQERADQLVIGLRMLIEKDHAIENGPGASK